MCTDQGLSFYPTYLYHYDEETGEIEFVHQHGDTTWNDILGFWDRPICRVNAGVNEDSDIYAIWTQFDTSEVCAAGKGVGDLFMTSRLNNDIFWEFPVNVTNSHTPGCYPGQCDSDVWASLADVIDDSLYILYIDDCDPADQEWLNSQNNVLYYTYPAYVIPSVDEMGALPGKLNLHQNYPNPFNNETLISFDLKYDSPVDLTIYDITGAEIANLINRNLAAGNHKIKWQPRGISSGVYLYKLKMESKSITKKMVFLK